jgi:hypothetical protein
MSVTTMPVAMRPASRHWVTAQILGVVLMLVLIATLVLWPKPTLHVLWDMVIPLLPAVFLVNPLLWRNVCPLATLNAVSGRVGYRAFGGSTALTAWTAGIVLLLVMVPARRFVFNSNGPVLSLTIAAVAALALVAGVLYARRAGFCNAICPALPVEKLYGQAPLRRCSPLCPSGSTTGGSRRRWATRTDPPK